MIPYLDGGFHAAKLIRALQPDTHLSRMLITRFVEDIEHSAWFVETMRWRRLDFFDILHKNMVENMLNNRMAPFPRTCRIAQQVLDINPLHENALLIIEASSWSPRSNRLFSDATRARAKELLKIGYKLNIRFDCCFMDIWREIVMAYALSTRGQKL
jgi:hypothetical protein